MFNDGGPVRRPGSGEGLVSGDSLPKGFSPNRSGEESFGSSSVKRSDNADELFEWLGAGLDEEVAVEEAVPAPTVAESAPQTSNVRRSGEWKLSVDNKKASLAALLSVSGYRFGMLAVALVLVLRVGDIFGLLGPVPVGSQLLIMGTAFLVTFTCGFTSLCLVLRKDVARRGERFVKRVVQLSLSAMLFMNVLIFVLLFSVFVWPDLSSLL